MLEKSDQKTPAQTPVVVKKYANRRLYNTETSTYVTLEDLAAMVRAERDFVVFDAKSGDDLTHSILTQIIVEQEGRAGSNPMLPVPFLRQLIGAYGKGIEHMVPSYLQASLAALMSQHERLSKQFTSTLRGNPFEVYQEQARKNMEIFEKAMATMFTPFGMPGSTAQNPADDTSPTADTPRDDKNVAEMEQLKSQMAAMQKMLDKLSKERR